MSASLHRAVWRWHFWAGLLVLPFLLWLAVTGALYLYKPEIERAVYGGWTRVAPAGPTLPLGRIAARAGRATGARVVQIARPADPAESWRLTLVRPDGVKRTAFINPHDGRVLGETRHGGVMGLVRELHGLAIAGPVGNALVEIAAGWAVVLVATGLYLWWPRDAGPALSLRGRPRGRLFWRDLHASTGALAGGVVLFLALTGLPWSGVWGEALQDRIAAHDLGRPKPPTVRPHGDHDAAPVLPWSLERAPAPHGGPDRIGPGRALASAEARGMATPWTLTFPARPGEPYLVSRVVARAEDAHVVRMDAATGAVLQDTRYAAFGAGAQVVEWGIATHQGQQYGEANRLVVLAGCVALALLCVSALVMWWRHRPRGRLGAPPGRSGRGLLAIMLGAGLLFPLTGLTMLAALAVERAGRAMRRKRTARA